MKTIDPNLPQVNRAALVLLNRLKQYSDDPQDMRDINVDIEEAHLTREEYDSVVTEASFLVSKAMDHVKNES